MLDLLLQRHKSQIVHLPQAQHRSHMTSTPSTRSSQNPPGDCTPTLSEPAGPVPLARENDPWGAIASPSRKGPDRIEGGRGVRHCYWVPRGRLQTSPGTAPAVRMFAYACLRRSWGSRSDGCPASLIRRSSIFLSFLPLIRPTQRLLRRPRPTSHACTLDPRRAPLFQSLTSARASQLDAL